MNDKLRTMISKWVIEDKLNDMQIGAQIRKHYWKEIHSYEHWLNEGEGMSGYGYDDASSYRDNEVELTGQELDDIYGPI